MSEHILVFYWPDGTWVESTEYSEQEFQWKRMQHQQLVLPATMTDAEIDIRVRNEI